MPEQNGSPSAAGNAVDRYLGKVIKKRRKGLKMTTEELDQRAGLLAGTIKGYETGEQRIPAADLFRIGKVLHLSPNQLFKGMKDEKLAKEKPKKRAKKRKN